MNINNIDDPSRLATAIKHSASRITEEGLYELILACFIRLGEGVGWGRVGGSRLKLLKQIQNRIMLILSISPYLLLYGIY